MLFQLYVRFHSVSSVLVTEWPPIGLLTRLTICSISISTKLSVWFFPPPFLSGNFILIAPFPDRCLLVPFYTLYILMGSTNVDDVTKLSVKLAQTDTYLATRKVYRLPEDSVEKRRI